MAEPPIPCREPFVMAECDLPLHHDGKHEATLTPPPHVSALYDQALAHLTQATRRASLWRWVFIIATATQIGVTIQRLFGGNLS